MLSLNLLPPQEKQSAALEIQYEQWRRVLQVVVLTVVISLGGLGTQLVMTRSQAALLQKQLSSIQQRAQKTESGKLTTVTNELNRTITALSQMIPASVHWGSQFSSAINVIPAGVTITSFSVDQDGHVVLSGITATRSTFIALQTALIGSPLFQHMTTKDTPSRRDSLPFTYQGTILSPKSP
ncbi:MAG: hypothetical protein HY092_03945 [Candidatus Kerfeldbacteria bacterium]|nr:hypothetical protein [Candidatus Kerfeldbacteria bacterium]